jgi:hypothetical protein
MRLSRDGSQVSGVFQAESFAVPVIGAVSDTGSVSLRGTRASPGPNSPTVELVSFTTASGELTDAQLRYELRYPNTASTGTNGPVQAMTGRVTQVHRGDTTPPTSFTGTWRGNAFTRDCSVVGWLFCWPEERFHEYVVTLVLSQSGDRVSGTFTFVARVLNVTGTVSGNSVTLDEARDERPVSSARDVFRLERSTLTRDAVGQLTGSLRYVRETIWDASLNRQTYVSRYDTDLSAILVP